jgi:outer membrane protein assembly factor BamB
VPGLLAVAGIALSQMLRVDGTIDGRGLPRFAWKWTKPPKAPLTAPSLTPPPAVEAPKIWIKDVPQFFGPNRDGKITGAHLADWSDSPPRELWRQAIGAGWSSFSVVAGRAFTQEQSGNEECVTCYDVLTGDLLWMHRTQARFYQWQSGEGPHSTPTIDRGKVFAYGATGVLTCLDAAAGTLVWTRHVLHDNGLKNLEWGISASPLVLGELVIVTGGQPAGPTVLAFDRATGQERWRSGEDRASYSSPIAGRLAGREVVISFNAATFTVHDLQSGELLLSQRWGADKPPKGAQPVLLDGDRLFVTAGYGMGCEMFQISTADDGELSARSLWKNLRMKAQFNSVAFRDGHLYGLDDGLLACVDAATGTRRWKEGRFGSGQSLLVDNLVLVQGERGTVTLLEASPEGCRELGQIPALSSKTWNHPTLAGRYLLVRNDREAVCYELPVKERAAP